VPTKFLRLRDGFGVDHDLKRFGSKHTAQNRVLISAFVTLSYASMDLID